MKVTLTLLMILAIANANMVQKYPLTYGGKRSIMNIMVEVENKIKSHSPLDTIKGVLDNFKSAVTEEQGTHDAVYVAQQAECQSEIGYRKAEVDDTIGTLKIANGILMFASVSTKMNKAFMIPLAALASIKQEENAAGAAERLVQLLQTLRSNVEEAWASYTAEKKMHQLYSSNKRFILSYLRKT